MIRLDKFIANNTIYSRQQINKMIRSKNVFVNNVLITKVDFKIDSSKDQVKLNNNLIKPLDKYYIALNKPKNYICSNSNSEGFSVIELVDEIYQKNIHIVGRLDKDTTGLILLTNDGNFSHKIKSPKSLIEKEYQVWLNKELSKKDIENICNTPIEMDGKILKPIKIFNVDKNQLNIVIYEGKYHQIKRIFKLFNYEVIELNRIRIGNLKIDDLNIKCGMWKMIDKEEIF